MHSKDAQRQILFRHVAGAREGRQDTLSCKRFGLNDNDWSRLKLHVARVLDSQRCETPIPGSTSNWLKSIPRKLYEYLEAKLLNDNRVADAECPVNLAGWIDEYSASRGELNTLVSTDEAVIRDVSKLIRCGRNVVSIDEGCLADLLADLAEERRYAENTLARHVKHWSQFFGWLKDQDVISTNPCTHLDRSMVPRDKTSIRPEWIDQMVQSCRTAEERYWLRLMQWTGCRLREGLTLRAKDFDLVKNRILIQESKNNRVRVNPIYPAIANYVTELLRGLGPDDRLLSRITEHNCYDWIYELQDRVGVPRWSPPYNSFRATRANQLASDPTITPQQAGLLLGHSPTVARRNYLSVEESLLERLAS